MRVSDDQDASIALEPDALIRSVDMHYNPSKILLLRTDA